MAWKDRTEEEKIEILRKGIQASMQRDYKTQNEIKKEIPISPRLANAIKRTYGLKHLLDGGWNFSEVEKEFGKEWFEA